MWRPWSQPDSETDTGSSNQLHNNSDLDNISKQYHVVSTQPGGSQLQMKRSSTLIVPETSSGSSESINSSHTKDYLLYLNALSEQNQQAGNIYKLSSIIF